MSRRNHADLISGVLVAAFGVAVALYAQSHYPLGTLRRMGPGMFPLGLGLTIAILGAALAIAAWFQPAEGQRRDSVQWRPAVLVVLGVIAFSILIRVAGLFPAVVAVVGISAFSDTRATFLSVAVLSATLCALAVIIFKLALGMNFQLLVWPF
jgi:hypothetical protein